MLTIPAGVFGAWETRRHAMRLCGPVQPKEPCPKRGDTLKSQGLGFSATRVVLEKTQLQGSINMTNASINMGRLQLIACLDVNILKVPN